MAVREAGVGEPVVFVHGNVSTGGVWDEQLAALPDGLRGVAVDLRGYGETEVEPVDATRGLRDFSDDLRALIEVLALGPAHLVSHSMGAGVVLQYACDFPAEVRSLALVAPMSPYGFGGTRDEDGTPCHADFAGSGGGTGQPGAAQAHRRERPDHRAHRLAARGHPVPVLPSPETVRDEEAILEAMLTATVGPDNYPGDAAASPNWPHAAPGTRGVLNAFSPKHCNLSGFATCGCRAPVLWLRGARDAVVADASPLDFAVLGRLGVVPGWPGAEVYPPQPMVSQLRKVLTTYAGAGGSYREEIWDGAGHFPSPRNRNVSRPCSLTSSAARARRDRSSPPHPTRSRPTRNISVPVPAAPPSH